mgnify:CR=1 FL=1
MTQISFLLKHFQAAPQLDFLGYDEMNSYLLGLVIDLNFDGILLTFK